MEGFMSENVINSKEGKVFVTKSGQNIVLARAKKVETSMALNKTEIRMLGKRGVGHKVTSWNGSGSLELYQSTSELKRWAIDYAKTGVIPYFNIQTEVEDPSTNFGRESIVYTGCLFDEITMSALNSEDGVLEDEISFTYEDIELLAEYNRQNQGEMLIKSDSLIYDISQLVTPVDFTDNINTAGITTFGMLPSSGVVPEEGDGVNITCNGICVAGYIFKVGHSETGEAKVTVYDQLRYLRANDTFVFQNNETASEIVTQLCTYMELKPGVIEETGHGLGTMTFDDKALLDMIADCVTKTLVETRHLYFLKDNAGKVEFHDIQNCIQDLEIGPDSLMYGYNYERDIDSDTYNQIKLARDNKETGQREIYMTKDSGNIKTWGTLQYYEKLDDEVNAEQAKEKADSLLYLKNRVGQKLSLPLLGDKRIRAGNMLYVSLPDHGIGKYLLCTQAKHKFTNAAHTVNAEFKLV